MEPDQESQISILVSNSSGEAVQLDEGHYLGDASEECVVADNTSGRADVESDTSNESPVGSSETSCV